MLQLRYEACGTGVQGGWWQGQGGGYIFYPTHGEAGKDGYRLQQAHRGKKSYESRVKIERESATLPDSFR